MDAVRLHGEACSRGYPNARLGMEAQSEDPWASGSTATACTKGGESRRWMMQPRVDRCHPDETEGGKVTSRPIGPRGMPPGALDSLVLPGAVGPIGEMERTRMAGMESCDND